MEIRWDFAVTAFFLLLAAVITSLVPRFPRPVAYACVILAAMFVAGMFIRPQFFIAWAIAVLIVAAIAGLVLFVSYLRMLGDISRRR